MTSIDGPLDFADHVVGVFPREGLSAALASIHRAGFGPQTRVLDSARGDPSRQLERAGLRFATDERPPSNAVLIVVTSPGRTTIVSDLFQRLGATSVQLAARRGTEPRERATAPLHLPDIRINEDQASGSGT